MRLLEGIERLLSLILALTVGILLVEIGSDMRIPLWSPTVEGPQLLAKVLQTPTGNLAVSGVGMVYLIVFLIILLELSRKIQRAEVWSAATEIGRIGITCDAIRQLILHYCSGLPVLFQSKPRIRIVKGKVEVHCAVKAIHMEDQSTSELCRQVQDAIRASIKEALGIDDIASIHVTVTRMMLRPPSPPPTPETEEQVSNV